MMDANLQPYPTPSQTVGPFYSIGLEWMHGQLPGDIRITGRLLDIDGVGIPDALLEVWDSKHKRFARIPTAVDGGFVIHTGSFQFLSVHVLMRGLLRHVHTRVYSPEANLIEDEVFGLVPQSRRATLVAQGSGRTLTWDIHMQGAKETVFFST
jgi:protocatechuate 3,4-dioxygenase alpha subunit